jgi:cyclopropane fatty-acyl-phospholipid synthase-like methyltransferase
LCSHVKSIIGIDISQAMVDEYNKTVWQQGIDENEMKAICLELKESEGDQLNGRKFDLVVVKYNFNQVAKKNWQHFNLTFFYAVRFCLSSYR